VTWRRGGTHPRRVPLLVRRALWLGLPIFQLLLIVQLPEHVPRHTALLGWQSLEHLWECAQGRQPHGCAICAISWQCFVDGLTTKDSWLDSWWDTIKHQAGRACNPVRIPSIQRITIHSICQTCTSCGFVALCGGYFAHIPCSPTSTLLPAILSKQHPCERDLALLHIPVLRPQDKTRLPCVRWVLHGAPRWRPASINSARCGGFVTRPSPRDLSCLQVSEATYAGLKTKGSTSAATHRSFGVLSARFRQSDSF
jgi:hypothetical protein